MDAKDVLRSDLELCHMVSGSYIADLTDAELVARSVPGSNHIAWQLGHLISSDCEMLKMLGHKAPALPVGFAEKHTKETAGSEDPAKFCKQAEYVALKEKTKAAALAAIDATPDAELGKPAPEAMRSYAPTVMAALSILGSHWLMHAGQWVPIRRKLGKPPLF